jgi:DNA-directed RNA polymerase subunit RPC12/RpoP
MKSIKPGRGPSAMGAMGSIVSVIFGIFWTIMASSMDAPSFFPLFGIIFIIVGIVQTIYNFKNATGTNRFFVYDIMDSSEESDPLQELFGKNRNTETTTQNIDSNERFSFCPYCGIKINSDFEFCQKCGKKLN